MRLRNPTEDKRAFRLTSADREARRKLFPPFCRTDLT